MKKLVILTFIIILPLMAGSGKAFGDLYIVGTRDLAGATINEEDLKSILVGKKTTAGNKIVKFAVYRDSNNPTHEELCKFVGKSTSQFDMNWKSVLFSGNGKYPYKVDNEAAMIDAGKRGGENGDINMIFLGSPPPENSGFTVIQIIKSK